MNSDMKMTTDANMETKSNANAPIDAKTISRRQILKGTGALVVGFNLFDPISHVMAQVSARRTWRSERRAASRRRSIPGSPSAATA